jgi:hypothetical protein
MFNFFVKVVVERDSACFFCNVRRPEVLVYFGVCLMRLPTQFCTQGMAVRIQGREPATQRPGTYNCGFL